MQFSEWKMNKPVNKKRLRALEYNRKRKAEKEQDKLLYKKVLKECYGPLFKELLQWEKEYKKSNKSVKM